MAGVRPCRRVLAAVVLLAATACAAPTSSLQRTGTTTMRTVSYGPHRSQVADLRLPRDGRDLPVAVLLHGGFWLDRYGRQLMAPLARDLVAAGWAVYNVEYRRLGGGGGWPETLQDAAAAVDRLADPDLARLDQDRVVVVGHSAGGHLALWAAARSRLPDGVVGAEPRVRPCAVVAQAAVSDLARAAGEELGGGAATRLLGGRPDEVPDRYAVADPAARLPLGVPTLLVHGRDDVLVPPGMSRRFAAAARAAGDPVGLELVPGDHFVHLDPSGAAWAVVRDRLPGLC